LRPGKSRPQPRRLGEISCRSRTKQSKSARDLELTTLPIQDKAIESFKRVHERPARGGAFIEGRLDPFSLPLSQFFKELFFKPLAGFWI
jgi:hypothetical protein